MYWLNLIQQFGNGLAKGDIFRHSKGRTFAALISKRDMSKIPNDATNRKGEGQ
ncbi:MAG: hypothetical protein OIF58_11360 [Cohaesibacter sp.]|nr:hypothetical protein [Cohaesibacter sp.]